jgi:hypothetical protein
LLGGIIKMIVLEARKIEALTPVAHLRLSRHDQENLVRPGRGR